MDTRFPGATLDLTEARMRADLTDARMRADFAGTRMRLDCIRHAHAG
jgi:hypothetical protein